MSSLTPTFSSADEFSPLQPILPNLSTSEEMSVLIARIAELNRAKSTEPSIACSADLFGQDGNASEEKLSQFQNDQKKILEKINEMEKQHKEQTKATSDQFSKIQNDQKILLEKVSELEKEQKQRKALLNLRQNYWDANVCSKNLEITGNKSLIAHYNGHAFGLCSVFAKHPILLNNDSSDIFYYEISLKKDMNWVIFGFAVKQPTKLEGTIRDEKGTYAYDSFSGIWINGERQEINDEYCYGEGDTVGIGANSATQQIIFTKNGLRLDFFAFPVAASFADHSFYPFVSLFNFGDEIEANFGPNFKFGLI